MDIYRYQIFDDIDERAMYGFSSFIDTVPKDSGVVIEITSHGGLVFYGNAVYQKIMALYGHKSTGTPETPDKTV